MRILKHSLGMVKLSSIDALECEHWSGSWSVYIHYGAKYVKITVPSREAGMSKIDKLTDYIITENKGGNIIKWEEL